MKKSTLEIIRSQHSRNPLAMFSPQPEGVTFEAEQKGEKIILLLRAHIVTLLPSVLEIIFLALLPILISLFNFAGLDPYSAFEAPQLFWVLLVWYLFVFGFTYYKFIFWFFNVYLLTNERIVDFDFKGITHKEIAYANLDQIQDVTPKVVGFFHTFFNFGNVFIQTASTNPEFDFHSVEKPDMVARTIMEELRKEQTEAPGEIA